MREEAEGAMCGLFIIFSGLGDFKAGDHPGDGCDPEGTGCIMDGG